VWAERSPAELEDCQLRHAATAHAPPDRVEGLTLAVDEVVTNALRHGGGRGVVRACREAGGLLCEVCDSGTITEPLVGRIRPDPQRPEGRGLWIANHFCDLVQIRSSRAGTVVRCHVALAASPVPV
jgi:anti-sigma regulatory factor (Ser/Thr protein kinase)